MCLYEGWLYHHHNVWKCHGYGRYVKMLTFVLITIVEKQIFFLLRYSSRFNFDVACNMDFHRRVCPKMP